MTGFSNPTSEVKIGSFTVSTADSSGYSIESISTGITVAMTGVNSLTSFTPTLSSLVNGNSGGTLQISVAVSCGITSGGILKFTVPSDITLASSLTCSVGTLVSAVSSCSQTSNAVSATLTFTAGSVSSGQTFSFYINSVKNPGSTKPTGSFTSISVTDSSGNLISSYSGTPTTATTTYATATGSLL